MNAILTDSAAELLVLLATVALSGILAVAGAILELQALLNFATGHVTLGAWELAFGGLLLYAGVYLLGYQRVVRIIASSEKQG